MNRRRRRERQERQRSLIEEQESFRKSIKEVEGNGLASPFPAALKSPEITPKSTQIYDSRRPSQDQEPPKVSRVPDTPDSPENMPSCIKDTEAPSSEGLAPSDFLFGAVTIETEPAEEEEESALSGGSSLLNPCDFFSGEVTIERSPSPPPSPMKDVNQNVSFENSVPSPIAMFPAFSSDACHNSIMSQLVDTELRKEGDDLSLASTASTASSVHEPLVKQTSLSALNDSDHIGEFACLLSLISLLSSVLKRG